MDRRDFLKLLGAGSLASVAVAAGCQHPDESSVEGFSQGEVPTDKMSYRLDSHGNRVSLLGYGCMRLPTVGNVSGREDDSELDQDQVNLLVDYAIAHGVNLFDTAPPYCKGRSQKAVGIALSRHNRNEYFISTKLSNFDASTWSREASMRIYRTMFEDLQVDYIDYLMLHGIGMPADDLAGNHLTGMEAFQHRFIDNGMLDFLLQERAAGRIRNLGFSYHGDIEVFDYLLSRHEEIHWDHVLIQHNYINWQHAKAVSARDTDSEYLYAQLAQRDIPIFVMEPLLGGRLAELPDYAVEQMKQREPQQSVASWAFRFAANQPRILTVLSGMTYLEHLQDNIKTYSPHTPLSAEEEQMLHDIAEVYVKYPFVPCTDCKYCMPCPYGIDIPGNFAHFNKSINEGDMVSDDMDAKAYRKARRKYLVSLNRSVETLRQADHCIGCGKCLVKCPQGIDIPGQLQRIEQYLESLRGKESV